MTQMSPAAGAMASAAQPEKTPRGYSPGLAGVNFGVYLALITPAMLSMAFKVQHISPSTEVATTRLGLILGVGALVALLANPLAGRLSDRTASRFGMRRPWILGGALVSLAGLALIGVATSVWVVLVAWCLVQAAMNAVLAAANATIPDQVPELQRGKVSGILGVMTPFAILAGSFLMTQTPRRLRALRPPGCHRGSALVPVRPRAQGPPPRAQPEQRLTLGQFFGSFVFNPVKHRDFGWTWLTKFLVVFGYAGIATFMPFYLSEKFHLAEQDALQTILLVNLASMAAMMISSPIGGILSDRIGKRRPFVSAAGIIMVVGLALIAFAPSIPVIIMAQAIVGFGAGSFFSVDLALATQVLPDPEDTAKDLGVLNMANALPQSIAPAMAPAIIALGAATPLGGYAVWYLFGAFVALTGAILVYRIKGVK